MFQRFPLDPGKQSGRVVPGYFSSSKCGDVKQTHLTVKVGFLICIFTEIIILVSLSRDFIIRNLDEKGTLVIIACNYWIAGAH